ncbi:MAG TPA: hypothetical protein VN844_16405 [Pyrinomonadaceae bacterium]|nr:hypothetical protein [Pyrinomonadaceae bacterium]
MGLTLEFHEVADLPSLDRLWAEETDWGEQSSELRRWFMEAPFGKPSVVIASDDTTGKAVGQFRFMPARVSVNGREVSAVRPFGTIVTKDAHEAAAARGPLDNPIWAMYFRGVDEFRARGIELIYIVPDERWVGFLKRGSVILAMAGMKYGSFPLWSLQLPLTDGPMSLGEGFTASSLVNWDEVDQLWEASRKLHGCMVVRDANMLRWKLAQATFTITAIKCDGKLVGLVASREKGDRQWLICDLLAADDGPALRATLAAAVNAGHEEAIARVGANELRKAGVLATSVMEPAVRSLGFERDEYDFPLVVQVLDKSLQADDVKLERWYVSAND